MVKYLKFFVVFPFVFCFIANVYADGCALNYGTSSEVIYYGAAAGVKNFTFPVAYRSGSAMYATACPKYDYNTAVTDGTSCTIVGRSGTYSYIPTSRIVFLPCPIDDYLPLLLLAASFAGFLVIRVKAGINVLSF